MSEYSTDELVMGLGEILKQSNTSESKPRIVLIKNEIVNTIIAKLRAGDKLLEWMKKEEDRLGEANPMGMTDRSKAIADYEREEKE